MNTENSINEIISKIIYPGFNKTIGEFGFFKDIKLSEKIEIFLDIPSNAKEIEEQLRLEIEKKLQIVTDKEIIINIKKPPMPRKTSSNGKNMLPNIQNFIMVSSGKGGVGKSTTTVNLALALAQQGKRVALLDADIYGPNIPRMLGIDGQQPIFMGNKIKPLIAHNIKVMSIGSIIAKDASLIWKGAMVTQAIENMIEDIMWGNVDVLLFDMPPGTGDAQLALAQNVPITAGVTVTTPQKVALDDTIRSLDMFKQLNIPIAGIVENMSGFICPDNGKEYNIFGKGTSQEVANTYNTKVLGEIPIDISIREGGDSGLPITILAPKCEVSKRYHEIASKLWESMVKINSNEGVDNSAIQPTIF